MKLGDIVTVIERNDVIRLAHVTNVFVDRVGAAATTWSPRRKSTSWSGTLYLSDEGITWLRGSHASKGKPTTDAGRALVTAYTLRSA